MVGWETENEIGAISMSEMFTANTVGKESLRAFLVSSRNVPIADELLNQQLLAENLSSCLQLSLT